MNFPHQQYTCIGIRTVNYAKCTILVSDKSITSLIWFLDIVKENCKRIEIFSLVRPDQGHYIILEILGMPNGRTFQIVKLPENQSLKVGRGHDADVRVADISVSRCHSLIRLDSINNQVILSDYHSKFGTLLLLREPLQIPHPQETNSEIQI